MTEKKDGIVDALDVRERNYALVINQTKYWGEKPAVYDDGTPISVGDNAVVEWDLNTLESGAKLRQMTQKPQKIETGLQQELSPKPTNDDHRKKNVALMVECIKDAEEIITGVNRARAEFDAMPLRPDEIAVALFMLRASHQYYEVGK